MGRSGTGARLKGHSQVAPGLASPAVLLVENHKSNARRAEEIVTSLGYRARLADGTEHALRAMVGDSPPDIVLVGIPGGEPVARAAQDRGEDRPSVVLAVSGQTSEAANRCDVLGADAFVLRPYKRDSVGAALRAAAVLRIERRKIADLEAQLKAEKKRGPLGEADPTTGLYRLELFQAFLVLELKRARRYGYALAACLVALDEPPVGVSAAGREGLHLQAARMVRKAVRDIDLPVDYADGKFLVFLPYTDVAGAERVGRRIEEMVREGAGVVDGGHPIAASVSVGIAALGPGTQVSFARLIRDARAALHDAQVQGGGRVAVRA